MLRLTIVLLTLPLALTVGCASQRTAAPYTWEMEFEEVEAQVDLQAQNDWHDAYMQEFLARHDEYAREYFPTCGRYLLSGGYTDLELLFVLDASGKIIGLRTRPNVPEALCFVDFFGSFDYPEPGRELYGKLHISANVQSPVEPLTSEQPDAGPHPDLRKTLTGSWAWTEEQCAIDPIRISFSRDGSLMYHRNREGLFLGDKNSRKEQVVYHILEETDRALRTMIEGEDRQTPQGETVGWDLILLSEDAFCWHRWDWPEECTQPLIACD